MDFHSLTRRELQAICKKNKIPANITNVAMADALRALHTVQGIEELLKPSESSIESPAKSRGTTITHRKTTFKEDESETLQTLTRTRRSTRRLVAAGGGDVDEAPDNGRKGTLPASACRKMETEFNEIEEEEEEDNVGKENEKFPETPAIMAANRQRGLKGDTTLKHTYSTRRSARLAEKNMEDSITIKVKEGSQTVKTELFSREILVINVKKYCPADVDPVTESSVAGVYLKLKSEQGSDNSYNAEVVSGTKSYCSMENHNNFQIDSNEDGGEDSGIGESNKTVESDGGGEQGDRCDNESNKANTNKTEDALESGEELDTDEEMGSNDVTAEDVAEVIDHNDVISSEISTDLKISEGELLESKKDFGLSNYTNASFEDGKNMNGEKEMESEDGAAQGLADDEKDTSSEDLDALMNINGVIESNESGEYESDLLVPKTEQAVDNLVEISASGEEAFVDHLTGKFIAMELHASAADRDTLKQSGHDNLNNVVVPTNGCLTPKKKETPNPRKSAATPPKKSVSKKKTPTAAAKRAMMTQEISDDKENIGNNGINLIIAKEKKEKKQTREENFQKPLDEQSLRQLTKMLKEKLEITKKMNINDDKTNINNSKTASTARPALQALSENRLES